MNGLYPYVQVVAVAGAYPWFLYGIATGFGISSAWEKGRKERVVISIIVFFFATVILIVLVWPDSYRAIADMIRADYYFPED